MATLKITITEYQCERCGYRWIPRGGKPPKNCASKKCKSPYWDRPRRNQALLVGGSRPIRHGAGREAVRAWIKPGMEIDTGIYGRGIVKKINRKTATICNTGTSGTFQVNVDLSFLKK